MSFWQCEKCGGTPGVTWCCTDKSMTANTETEQLHQLLELVLTELDRKSIPFAYMQEIDRKGKAFIEQAARRAPAVPVPQGWKLVPSESTEEMARAFRADDAPHYFVMTTMRCNDFAERYRAAISAAPQPPDAALVPSIAVTPEMVEAANEAYCPFGDMELALCAALQVAPIPPGAAPVQLPENIREGEPYDNPAFEALARALGVWGTAQSAVCAQFWIAAKEQST